MNTLASCIQFLNVHQVQIDFHSFLALLSEFDLAVYTNTDNISLVNTPKKYRKVSTNTEVH